MRVLIADDHDLVRDTIVAYVEATGEVQTSVAADLNGVFKVMETEGPFDLILLDFKMPGMNGLSGLKRVMDSPGSPRVALISGEATRDIAEQALEAGAAGFVPKTLKAKTLVNAIRFMAMGEQYAPVDFMSANPEESVHPLVEKLTPRETQVLRGLVQGKSNKEIARDLDVSEPTVKLHVKAVYRKFEVSNRTQAAMLAKEAGVT